MSNYILNGQKWGGTSEGSSGGTVTWSFAETSGDIFDFDFQISSSTYQNLIRDAFDRWESVADIDFVEVSDNSSVDIRLGWDQIDGASGTLGEASWYYYYSNGDYDSLSEAEIRFDYEENWSTDPDYVGSQANFYAVALHEIGHSIGLGHPTNPDTLMYAYSVDQTDLHYWDIYGIEIIYGAAEADDFIGGSADEVLSGTSDADFMSGGGGDDTIYGYAGNDSIFAGSGDLGDDYIESGTGDDIVGGGAGDDTIYAGTGSDKFFGVSGDDRLYGETGNDTIWAGSGEDYVNGGNNNDRIGAREGSDTIYGGSGDDTVYAADGNDWVNAGSGDDLVYGGDGNDTIIGGSGDDDLYGRGDNDVFEFGTSFGNDTINDFGEMGSDSIDLTALGLSGISDLSISQSGADVLIDTGSGTILIIDTSESEISSSDFIF
ncbi:matrixin family metalloprotease [Labrenzia sp. CE80]|uniref:matrixin family metalloprotease n=1 Tax=Labrenzia sp. CE80 TaxID=1788986 RepID=UPI0013899B10|nr:matrixin family metalloprotease [Labrenzia sp. CE80]